MVRAWYMDEAKANPKDPHQTIPPKYITLEELYKLTGVEYIEIENIENSNALETLKEEKGTYVEVPMSNIDEEYIKVSFSEHMHADDELRLVLDGSGYYDFRDKYEHWIRMEVITGDAIVIPGGCYHRFTIDNREKFEGLKLVSDEVCQSIVRPADDMDCRKNYIKKLYNGSFDRPLNQPQL